MFVIQSEVTLRYLESLCEYESHCFIVQETVVCFWTFVFCICFSFSSTHWFIVGLYPSAIKHCYYRHHPGWAAVSRQCVNFQLDPIGVKYWTSLNLWPRCWVQVLWKPCEVTWVFEVDMIGASTKNLRWVQIPVTLISRSEVGGQLFWKSS